MLDVIYMTEDNKNIEVYKDKKQLSEAALIHFLDIANHSITQKGRFTVCLAGGSTPNLLYSLLGNPKASTLVDWKKVFVFWGDERCVPINHNDSNYFAAQRQFLSKIPIPIENIHRVQTELSCKTAAQLYEDLLRSFFQIPKDLKKPHTFSTFDLVLLGLGTDGHIASIFPDTISKFDQTRLAVCKVHHKPPPPLVNRVSLTFTSINAASQVFFLVSGKEKANIISQVIKKRTSNHKTIPANLVKPRTGKLRWLLDEEAASKL